MCLECDGDGVADALELLERGVALGYAKALKRLNAEHARR